jgi:hypothetical protein
MRKSKGHVLPFASARKSTGEEQGSHRGRAEARVKSCLLPLLEKSRALVKN